MTDGQIHQHSCDLLLIIHILFQRCINTLEAEISDEEVQNEAENHMATLGDTTDDVPVQNKAENCMETPGDTTDDVPVQSEAENHMDTS